MRSTAYGLCVNDQRGASACQTALLLPTPCSDTTGGVGGATVQDEGLTLVCRDNALTQRHCPALETLALTALDGMLARY